LPGPVSFVCLSSFIFFSVQLIYLYLQTIKLLSVWPASRRWHFLFFPLIPESKVLRNLKKIITNIQAHAHWQTETYREVTRLFKCDKKVFQ